RGREREGSINIHPGLNPAPAPAPNHLPNLNLHLALSSPKKLLRIFHRTSAVRNKPTKKNRGPIVLPRVGTSVSVEDAAPSREGACPVRHRQLDRDDKMMPGEHNEGNFRSGALG